MLLLIREKPTKIMKYHFTSLEIRIATKQNKINTTTKKLHLMVRMQMNKYHSKISGHKANIQKTIIFLSISNNKIVFEIKIILLFTIVLKKEIGV